MPVFWLAIPAIVGAVAVYATAPYWASSKQQGPVIQVPGIEPNTAQAFSYGPEPALGNANYFAQVKDAFLTSSSTFIEVDLSKMELRYWENGAVALEVPVEAKGKLGTWWETPPGLYKVQSKIESHNSSFGRVIMPWNLPFQGNFFIHGWPSYYDGTPATSGFSGGCIRLSVDNAETLFTMVEVGTPILIFEDKFTGTHSDYQIEKPDLLADSYLAVDMSNNFVFLRDDEDKPYDIGALSTLMFAVVVSEHIGIERNLNTPEFDDKEHDDPRITAGESYRTYDLLFPLIEDWSSEAAYVLASHLGRVRAVDLMNSKRASLGMTDSEFVTAYNFRSTSTDAMNTATAEDLFFLAKYIHLYRPFIFDISNATIITYLYGEPVFGRREEPRVFPGFDDFVGGAYDGARGSVLAVFDLMIDGEERPVLFVVFDSEDPLEDVVQMRAHVLNTYSLTDTK